MAISAFLDEPALTAGSRRSARRKLRLQVQGEQGGTGIEVQVHDISETGLLIESETSLAIGEPIDLDLPHAGPVAAKVVWTNGRLFGCRFDTPVSTATLSAAELQSAVGADLHVDAHPASSQSEHFGARLQRLRTAKGLSQAEVAEHMDVSTPSISGWEKGRARPKHDRLAALADLMGVSVAELRGDSGTGKLHEVVENSRRQIAAAAGVEAEKVRISIEF